MAEREFEFGKVIPASEAEQEYIFDPEIRDLLASGDAIQGFPTSMVSERVGLPTALARGAADLFDTSRREVVMPAARELGDAIESYNPETFGFDERIEERLRPGVFMRPEEATSGPEARANMPLARGVSQAVDFAGDLIRSPETRAQAIETLRTVPETLAEQTKLSGIASLRGERVIDPETGMTGMPYDAFLSATTPLAVGRAVSDVPRASFGIFGSGGGKSGKQAEDTVAMLEESGLDPSEGWERQDGANTYKAYRSSLDGKVRYEIPTTNVAFRGVFRETEDPDVELGKLLDPETRDQQRLEAMQGLRIRKNSINDKDYIHVPGFFELDETQLNKYGFTKLDSKVGKGGLQKFPAPVLEQIVDFPELFDEYPQLRSIQIKPTPALAFFLKGAYNPKTKEISLASVPNTAEGRKEMMSTLLHEVQHAVQDIEGLYGGANTRMFEPAGFAERQTKNQDARRKLETNIEDSLDNLVVTLDDPGSKKPKTGLFSKIFGLSTLTPPPRTQKGLAGADKETDDGAAKVRSVKRATVHYLRQRAEEEEQIAAGELTIAERYRRDLEELIEMRKDSKRRAGKSEKEIADVETEYRGQAFRYGGSDREMIYLADKLKIAGVKNSEKVAERIGGAFDEQIQKLRPLLKEKEQIDEISSRSYEMYEGNPGEVEARNVQRRFEGIEEGEYLRAPSGQLKPFTDKITPVEMQNLDPEVTQGMVLPEGGLVYSLAEGRKGQPSFSIDDPNDPQMDLPGMGPPKPVPTEDPAANLLSMRDGMIGALREDELGSRKRSEIQASLNRVNQRIFRLRQEAGYPTDNLYANGGMVNNMRRRNISGLTNLLSKYNTSGPLAGAGVPRGTMPVEMNQGGRPDYAQFDRADFVRSLDPRAFDDVPDAVRAKIMSDLDRAARLTELQTPVEPEPVMGGMLTSFGPAVSSSGIVAGGPAPDEIEVIDTDDPYKYEARIKKKDPVPEFPDLPPPIYQPPEQQTGPPPTGDLFPQLGAPEIPERQEAAPVTAADPSFEIFGDDGFTPQTDIGYTAPETPIARTGDPFADAVEGEYQMPLYKPTPSIDMPFLSINYGRPPKAGDPPPPPVSENYSTGSFGRLQYQEALQRWENRFGPVEDYVPPSDDDTDDTSGGDTSGSNNQYPYDVTTSGSNNQYPYDEEPPLYLAQFYERYPEPPPTRRSGGAGPTMAYNKAKKEWEAKYGSIEAYEIAKEEAINAAIGPIGL